MRTLLEHGCDAAIVAGVIAIAIALPGAAFAFSRDTAKPSDRGTAEALAVWLVGALLVLFVALVVAAFAFCVTGGAF